MNGRWHTELASSIEAFLVTHQGARVAKMTRILARGIAGALNTKEGRMAFERILNDSEPDILSIQPSKLKQQLNGTWVKE